MSVAAEHSETAGGHNETSFREQSQTIKCLTLLHFAVVFHHIAVCIQVVGLQNTIVNGLLTKLLRPVTNDAPSAACFRIQGAYRTA